MLRVVARHGMLSGADVFADAHSPSESLRHAQERFSLHHAAAQTALLRFQSCVRTLLQLVGGMECQENMQGGIKLERRPQSALIQPFREG